MAQCHQKLGIILFLFFQIIILLSSSESPISPNTNFDFFQKKGSYSFLCQMFQQLKTEKILSKVLESFLIRIKLLLNELSEINLEKNVPLNHIIKKIYQIWSALADLYLVKNYIILCCAGEVLILEPLELPLIILVSKAKFKKKVCDSFLASEPPTFRGSPNIFLNQFIFIFFQLLKTSFN